MPQARGDLGWVSATAKERAADLHRAFADDRVRVVIAAMGGDHSNQLLPHLDYDLIARDPKVFQGYSDITVLHWAFAKFARLSTLYGPSLIGELAEFPTVLDYTDRYLRAAWFSDAPIVFEPAERWTDEELDWDARRRDLERPRTLSEGEGWLSLRGGVGRGPILAGCLETVCWHLKGSSVWIDPSNAVLFRETSQGRPPPATVDSLLTDLEQLGSSTRLVLSSSGGRSATGANRPNVSGRSLNTDCVRKCPGARQR